MNLSVVIIAFNEEANLGRTLASVQPLVADGKGEIIVVDSGSTDRTIEIAKSFGAKVFVEAWKGFAAQKNSAIDKATGDWILSLDADEELDLQLQRALRELLDALERLSALGKNAADHSLPATEPGLDIGTDFSGVWIPRKNEFLGRWIRHGGFWPDSKLRLFRRGSGKFESRAVHEDVHVEGFVRHIQNRRASPSFLPHALRLHRAHEPLLVAGRRDGCGASGKVRFSAINIVLRPRRHSSTTTFSASAFSTAAKACCSTSTTRFTFRGNMPRHGNSRASSRDGSQRRCKQRLYKYFVHSCDREHCR